MVSSDIGFEVVQVSRVLRTCPAELESGRRCRSSRFVLADEAAVNRAKRIDIGTLVRCLECGAVHEIDALEVVTLEPKAGDISLLSRRAF